MAEYEATMRQFLEEEVEWAGKDDAFIDAVVQVLADNDYTVPGQLARADDAVLVYPPDFSGGKRTFIREAIDAVKKQMKADESSSESDEEEQSAFASWLAISHA